MKVVRSGEVTVKMPFEIQWFDEDDGWCKDTIKPGTYEYQVLDVRGWKPRQLKVNGEWVDVADTCKDLETLLASVDETTTIASIAPTVDYVGHVKPVDLLKGDDSYEADYDKPDDDSRVEKDKNDPDWVSPIGRLIAGESVRNVIGAQFGLKEFTEYVDYYDSDEYLNDLASDYDEAVYSFKNAEKSPEKFLDYSGDFIASSELEYDDRNSDDDTDIWYFKVRDEELDSEIDRIHGIFSQKDFDYDTTKYFISVNILLDKGAPADKYKKQVDELLKSGKSVKPFIKSLLTSNDPYFQEVNFDYDF